MRRPLLAASVALALVACSPSGPNTEAAKADAEKAHAAYVAAINANDPAKVLETVTQDIVYLPPHEKALFGKDAVAPWLKAYFDGYSTVWEKTSVEFVVSGDWAFEHYHYKSTDTPKAGGAPVTDEGKGINIYHKDSDGVWRVARDAWSSDLPPPPPAPAAAAPATPATPQ
jgi:uncharacterized protein (TIGR02246 family)